MRKEREPCICSNIRKYRSQPCYRECTGDIDMDEPLLWVNLQESDKVAMWLVRYPQITDKVIDKPVDLNLIQGATLIFDLMAARDAAQVLHMAALEGGFE